LPLPFVLRYLGSLSHAALSYFLTVLCASTVRFAISLIESWSRNRMCLTLPTMSIVITSFSLLKYSAGTVEHPGQF
jgi:hypothetical protein